MKNKILLTFMATIICVFAFGVLSVSAEVITCGLLTYEIIDDEAIVISCDNNATGELVIPDTIGNYPVTKIGEGAFLGSDGLTNVVIPDSVTYIGNRAFESLEIKSVSLPDNDYTWVGEYAFVHCNNLESLYIPSGISFGYGALLECDNLSELYYEGLYPADWDYAEYDQGRIDLFGEWNRPATFYVPNMKATVSDDGKEIVVNLYNDFYIYEKEPLLLALYNGSRLVELQMKTEVNGSTAFFTTDKQYTTAKVMYWNFEYLYPISRAETITR